MPVVSPVASKAASGAGYDIRRVAVLGAGTMGAQIAGHIANAGYPVLLLDMASPQDRDHSTIARQAREKLKKSRPPAYVDPSVASLIEVGNFDEDLHRLAEMDWVIEVVAEQMPIKKSLLGKVVPHLRKNAILTSNTSGLSVKEIAVDFPADLKRRWFGTHFFNPPRYMGLFEMIQTPDTDPEALAALAHFAEVHLGKTPIPAKDRPNFIANRIGNFTLLNHMRLMQLQKLTVEEIDALTGAPLGLPKTGTFRLLDLVGIDVMAYVAHNFVKTIKDERPDVELPAYVDEMVKQRWIGDKAGQGFYKKQRDAAGKEQRLTLDPATMQYGPSREPDLPELAKIKNSDPASKRIPALMGDGPKAGKAAAFYWEMLPDLWLYSANRIGEISDSIADMDRALQTGYNWQLGPFAMWDAAGVPNTVARMREMGKPIPPVVEKLLKSGNTSWYRNDGTEYFDPSTGTYKPVPVPPRAVSLASCKRKGVVKENASASLVDLGDGVACIELHTKMNSLGSEPVAFIREVLDRDGDAMRRFDAFVIGGDGPHFSVGANLMEFMASVEKKDWKAIEDSIHNFQAMTQAIKFCSKPVVAAAFGMALGGGAEVCMHATLRQAHMELAMGLVEAGVGLLPGGGGCKEMTLRAIDTAGNVYTDRRGDSTEVHKTLMAAFETIAMAKVSSSALNARHLNFLLKSDPITMNRALLLADAKDEALRLATQGYLAAIPRVDVPAPGRAALAMLDMSLYIMREGAFISDHDVKVSRQVARVLCGGDIVAGTLVPESHFLDLEREGFLSLCSEPKTQERITFTLKTGKPLRN